MNCPSELHIFVALVVTAIVATIITLGICAAWAYHAMKVDIQ